MNPVFMLIYEIVITHDILPFIEICYSPVH
jgi:hypothetical protein